MNTDEIPQDFKRDLQSVRNNVHTYSKSGGYKKKADSIIANKLSEYKMDSPDYLIFLRNDISLVFIIEDNKRALIGCDYFIYHSFTSPGGKTWEGSRYIDYSIILSSAVKGFASAFDEKIYQLPNIKVKLQPKPPRIELFDYKSADVFARIEISQSIIFRLLLILTQISYPIVLIKHLLDTDSIFESDLWVCFFTKLLAIKYDEAFDNIQSMLDHAIKQDRVFIHNMLNSNEIDIEKLKARDFAQKLRNSIHYQDIPFDVSLCENETTIAIIKATYLSITNVKTMDDFRCLKNDMINEAQQLQSVIQQAFSLNKTY